VRSSYPLCRIVQENQGVSKRKNSSRSINIDYNRFLNEKAIKGPNRSAKRTRRVGEKVERKRVRDTDLRKVARKGKKGTFPVALELIICWQVFLFRLGKRLKGREGRKEGRKE